MSNRGQQAQPSSNGTTASDPVRGTPVLGEAITIAPTSTRAGSTGAPTFERPTLADLGHDLLEVSAVERFVSLGLPFLCVAGFFAAGARGWWWAALVFVIVQSFATYASVSHDLVHGNLGLHRRANETLLAVIELLALRSGHAYRLAHLHHHKAFPAPDDIEGRASGMPLWRALLDGLFAQPRQWWWALQRSHGVARRWIIAEGTGVLVLVAACVSALPWTPVPAAYAALTIAGSWIYPVMTSWMVHDPEGEDDLHQTRLFRGRIASVLAFEHLYHLEHHLYPRVPHQRWPLLARRLDPLFARAGLRPIVLGRWTRGALPGAKE